MSPYFGWQPACFLALVESALHARVRTLSAPRGGCHCILHEGPPFSGADDVPPARLAFFDDVEANVAGARRAGLQAHQVTGPDQIAAISEALLEL
jgi:hypothetical protein